MTLPAPPRRPVIWRPGISVRIAKKIVSHCIWIDMLCLAKILSARDFNRIERCHPQGKYDSSDA